MGGSSLAPEVLRRAFDRDRFHVLDTTHPKAIRRLAESLDLERTLFVVVVEVGHDARDALPSRLLLGASRQARRAQFAAITDPGSRARAARARARLSRRLRRRADDRRPLLGAVAVRARPGRADGRRPRPAARPAPRRRSNACRVAEDNPGLALGLALGHAWQEGRDKVLPEPNPYGFGLWVEQLLAESTGKDGRGPRARARASRPRAPTARSREVELDDPYDLGAEFFRWEFATAVAGAILEINPFDQPNVQEAKDRTNEILSEQGRVRPLASSRRGRSTSSFAQARPGDYVAIQAFVDPAEEERLRAARRARSRGDRLRRHVRARPAVPALDRPAAQGRRADRLLPAGRRRHRRRAGDPGPEVRLRPPHPRAGCGRLRGVEGARPPGRARATGGSHEPRNGRPRPDGREHGRAAARARAHRRDLRADEPGAHRRLAGRARRRSSRSRASSG